MHGELRGIFLGLLAVPAAIYVVAAAWRVTLARTLPPDARPDRTGFVSRLVSAAPLLVGLAWLVAVMAPVHARQGAAESYEALLARWWALLPLAAAGSALAGFLSSALGTSRPIALAFWLGMPAGAYAALAWTAYALVAGWVPPGDAAGRAELDRWAGPLMMILTAFPAAAFAAGLAGAAVGKRARPATP